jgi:hypothetical protein
MKPHPLATIPLASLFVLATLVSSGGRAAAASATTFSGQATVLSGQVAGQQVNLVDTGPVDAGGGHIHRSLLEYPGDLPDATGGALTAEVFHATVVAHGNKSSADATVANFSLHAAEQDITADFIAARATATCNSGTAAITASSEIVGLKVNGTPYTVGTAPQTITIPPVGPPVGSIAINEQPVASASGDTGNVTVNALHIVLSDPVLGDTNLVVASAHADIVCATAAVSGCANQDFVTGGGWITTDSGSRANFAVAGGPGGWGHLLYIDHGANGARAKGISVTNYVVMGPTTREIDGQEEGNAAAGSGSYTVVVTDGGEPGHGTDHFAIKLPLYEQTDRTIDGGNIQLHCK